jgi:hypothetical protein
VNESTIHEGATELWSLVEDNLIPIGARVAAALFGTVAQVEIDEPEDAVRRLRLLAGEVRTALGDGEVSPSQILVLRVLLLQLALREYETSSHSTAKETLEELRGLRTPKGQWDRFPVSKGVGWDSATVQRDAVEATRVYERMLSSRMEGFEGDTWIDVVRARAPWSDTRIKAHAASRDHQFLKKQFFDSAGRGTTKTLWSSGNPILREGWESLLAAELTGNLHEINHCRAALGRIRILTEPSDAKAVQDALRLLRIAGDKDSVDAAINRIQSQGPNEALRNDASVVCKRSSFPHRISHADLMVMSAASNFMSASELNVALDGVFNYIQNPPAEASGRSFRDERASWAAVARLLPDSGADDRVATEALRYLQANRATQILEDSFQNLVEEIAWDSVSGEVQADWREWGRTHLDHDGLKNLAVQAAVIGKPRTSERPYGALSDYFVAVQLANYHPDGAALSHQDRERAIQACLDALSAIQQQAGTGVMSVGGHDPGLLALSLAVKFDVPQLWDAVTELLINPAVDGYYKGPALDRLAQASDRIPERSLRTLSANWRSIVDSPFAESPFATDKLPYFPEAIRLGAILKKLSRDSVTELAGGDATASRKAASLTIPTVSKEFEEPEWGHVLLLQLSRDNDPDVRAIAGNGLALIGNVDSSMRDIVNRRLSELLGADGIRVPLRTLHGFQSAAREGEWNYVREVEARIASLAEQSDARVLRKAASEVQRLIAISRQPREP